MRLDLITTIIIVANLLVSLKGFGNFLFFEKYKFNTGSVQRGENIRFLTAGFLHVDMAHLIFNMITLYFFADEVINYLGQFYFIIIYFGGLLAGNLLSYYFHKTQFHYSAVGASGAVTGVLYSAIILNPDMMLNIMLIPIGIPGYVFGIGYLLYSIYGMKNSIGNIGHDAHIGGAIGGYVLTLIMAPWVFKEQLTLVILLAIPIVILYGLHKSGKL